MKSFMLKLFCFMLIVSTALFIGTACKNEDNSTHVCEYTKTVIPPTCDTQGYTLNKCSCGKNYKDTYVNPLNHDFANYISNNNATFDTDGTKTAKCERLGCNATDTVTDVGSKLQSEFKFNSNYEISGRNVFTKVSNTTETVYFPEEITLYGNASYEVYEDINCENELKGKEFVLSNLGNNKCYILATVNNVDTLYHVTIYRRSMFTVNFAFGNDETIPNQIIEEDSLAVKPEIAEKAGYGVFYNFDFDTPITKNETITIEYKAIFHVSSGSITSLTTYGKTLNVITIPEKIDDVTITSIGEGVFVNCTNLTSVTIHNSVTSIGDWAFAYCSNLTSVTIPNSTTSIGSNAFYDCDSVEKVYYLGDINSWAQIEFSNAYSTPLDYIAELYINNELVTTANITTATKISNYAFYNYKKLTSVTIGNSVTSIGRMAFYWCTNLTSITYNGTKSKWNNISKDSKWGDGTLATYVTCTDGTVNI